MINDFPLIFILIQIYEQSRCLLMFPFLSFAGILMKFSPASRNRSWRRLRIQSPPVCMRRTTSGWALLWTWKGFCLPFPCSCWFCSHPLQNKRENPIHIINVSIKTADTEDDDALVTAFTEFAQSKVGFHPDLVDSDIVSVFMMELKILYFFLVFILQKAVLFEYGIRRITFLIAQKVKPTVSCLYIAIYCS